MFKQKNFKKYFLFLLVIELFFSYSTVFAQVTPYNYATDAKVSDQIKKYLCTPSEVAPNQTNITNGALNSQGNFQEQAAFNNKSSGDLYTCINNMYKLAIIIAGVVGVFFIVIAGYVYMSAEGNDESVNKAKDILVSTFSSMVILMAGYILLKAINPDLIRFNNVQPPGVTGLPTAPIPGSGTTPGTGTGASRTFIIAGFNIGSYATDPNHESLVARIYNGMSNLDFSSTTNIDQYLKRAAPSTPLTGQMIFSSAQQNNVDAKLMIAIMQADSSLGTQGKGATSNNPGNVGSTSEGSVYDSGSRTTSFPSWQAGVNAVAVWLSNHRA